MQRVTKRYELETRLLRTNNELEETSACLAEVKYQRRDAWEKKNLYEGSIRSLMDRISGKREEVQERLARNYRQAEETVAALTREREILMQQQSTLQSELETLPSAEELRDMALSDSEMAAQWAELESKFCAEGLAHLLEKTDEALEQYRSQMRGERMGEMVSREDLYAIGTAHMKWAKQCQPLLERLEKAQAVLERPFETGGYFDNPAGYIESAAAKHNRLDRISAALGQVAKLRRTVEEIRRA